MPSVRALQENIPNTFSITGNLTAQLAGSASNPIVATVGGQQYRSIQTLNLNLAITGAGGLDTGSAAANTVYYIHMVAVSGSLSLLASLSRSAPTGFSSFKYTGYAFATNSTPAIEQIAISNSLTTVTRLTSGSGTYTLKNGCVRLKVTMVGGGAAGARNTNGSGEDGSASTFGTLTANGGSNGPSNGANAGGTATIGSGWTGQVFQGGGGAGGQTGNLPGSAGGSSIFGGGGHGGSAGSTTQGGAAGANTGAGGGAQGSSTGPGQGGGAGGGIIAWTTGFPLSSYSYSVGAGGTNAGESAGAGGSGVIIIEEFYG